MCAAALDVRLPFGFLAAVLAAGARCAPAVPSRTYLIPTIFPCAVVVGCGWLW